MPCWQQKPGLLLIKIVDKALEDSSAHLEGSSQIHPEDYAIAFPCSARLRTVLPG